MSVVAYVMASLDKFMKCSEAVNFVVRFDVLRDVLLMVTIWSVHEDFLFFDGHCFCVK
jgi:hypothetical protein